jgi:hypothetical protein
MSTELSKIAEKAKTDSKLRFTSLTHLLTPEFVKETWKRSTRLISMTPRMDSGRGETHTRHFAGYANASW